MTTLEIMKKAKAAKPGLAKVSTAKKDEALLKMASSLLAGTDSILSANREDIEAAKSTMSCVMLDRLSLTAERIQTMAEGMRKVAGLPDPVGEVLESFKHPNGMTIDKVSVPFGVVAIIFESRPNVSSDAAALAIKSGNSCILRGGKEAFRSVDAIVKRLQMGLSEAGLEADLVQLVQDTTRASARELMEGVGYIDLLIPRGGAELIRACTEGALVPCIQTGTGICHVFVDEAADQDMALKIIENAKTSRPSVCNAEEVCLVHERIAGEFLPKLYKRLVSDRNHPGIKPVELRLDEASARIITGVPAGASDFDTEFLDYILAVKTVGSLDAAIRHIAEHSTGHSDAIVTRDESAARTFTKCVDSAAVYVNASTRFTDGGEFGLGCEMGISTQKLHARGPLGLRELNTYKYIIHGNGQIR
jgi:glutamate-5-semialdehyde dehydrogenase